MSLKDWFAILLFGGFLYGLLLIGRNIDKWNHDCEARGGVRAEHGKCVQVIDVP